MTKDDVFREAARLFTQHGLIGWIVLFRDWGARLGACDHRTWTIYLNEHHLKSPASEVRDTLLHEVAHALTPGHGHDKVWKAVARKIGATPRASCTRQVHSRPGKWQAICPSCGRVWHKYRKPKFKKGYYCPGPKCGPSRGQLVFVPTSESAIK